MSMIGIISPPAKNSTVSSNCKITQEGNEIILTDDTSARPFVVKQDFHAVTDSFTNVINEVSTNDSMRIISFGSEFSTPNITQIKEWSIQLINQRFQGNPSQPIPISAGLVYDKDVYDLLSLRPGKSEKFELVESDDIYSAMDLIDFSFEKFKRFKETVFVLHIGIEPFFEWVVVPRVDHYVPTPSLTGLPPNEKLIFILKQFPTITESGITTGFDRFRRMSNIFKLVLDTFCDIRTLWVFHFATDVTFKSNNALFKIASYVSSIGSDSRQFQISRSNLFDVHTEEEEEGFKGLDPELLSNYLTEQQRRAAEAEGEKLGKLVGVQLSDDENTGRKRRKKVGKKKNANGEYEYEYEYEYGLYDGSSKSGRRKKRRARKGPDGKYEYEYYDYADGDRDGSDDNDLANGKGRRRRKKKSGDDGEDSENLESDDDEVGDLDVIEELNKIKQNKAKRGKGKGKGKDTNSEGDESFQSKGTKDSDLAKKAAEEEMRAKKAAEKEARDQKIKELLDKRKQGKKKGDESEKSSKKGSTKKKSKSNASPDSSTMSHRDKLNMMMQKFRNQLAQDGSDDFDSDIDEEEENLDNMSFLNFDTTGMTYDQIQRERKRRLDIMKEKKRRDAYSKRRENEHELLRLQALAVSALALARRADPNQSPLANQKGTYSMDDENKPSQFTRQQPVTNAEMISKDEEVVTELNNVEEARKKRVDNLLDLNKKLNDKKRKHEKYQATLKERRALFIDIHNKILQKKLEDLSNPRKRISYGEEEDENFNNSSELGNRRGGLNNGLDGDDENGYKQGGLGTGDDEYATNSGVSNRRGGLNNGNGNSDDDNDDLNNPSGNGNRRGRLGNDNKGNTDDDGNLNRSSGTGARGGNRRGNGNGDDDDNLGKSFGAGGRRNRRGNRNDDDNLNRSSGIGGRRGRRGNGNEGDDANFNNSTGVGNRKDGLNNRRGGINGNESKFSKSAKLDRAKARRKVDSSNRSKLKVKSSEYLQTKMLLEREIETVKKEIALIKRRQKAINHEI